MNTKISDAAVEAVMKVASDRYTPVLRPTAVRILEAALPHLQPSKPEAVRLRDELRKRANGCDEEGLGGTVEILGRTYLRSDVEAALAATGKQQVGDIPTMDSGLAAWLTARGLMPDADEHGCVEMDDVIEALNEHERQLAPEQQVGEAVTDQMVEAALQSTVAEPKAGTPWREVVALDDHADFIADMRKAINAAISAQPRTPNFSPATQAVPDNCDRIFWRHSYYTLPLGPSDRAKPTRRRQSAVELVQKLGFQWKNEVWRQVGEVQGDGLRGLVAKWRARQEEYDNQQSAESKKGYEVDWTPDAKARSFETAADELEAALAARQPVGRECGICGGDILTGCSSCGESEFYTDPPAQAVDLGQLPVVARLYERHTGRCTYRRASVTRAEGEPLVRLADVQDLINSGKAVQS